MDRSWGGICVSPGAERFPAVGLSLEHDRADGIVIVEPAVGLDERVFHLICEAVPGLRAAEDDDTDRSFALDADLDEVRVDIGGGHVVAL